MTVEIRRIAEDDRADWERLFKAYIEFYRSDVPDAVIAFTWQRLLAGPPDGFLGLVAERDGRVVGIAHVVFHPSTWSPTCYCYLEDLFVDPSVRGGGIGRRLIEAVYEAADAQGATRTYWTTQEFNYRARALYDTVATKTPFIRYQRQG
jgi:GNAT superfamily N-acetyltransferase